jgi:hypothetical protein
MARKPSDEAQAGPAQERPKRKPGERTALWAAIAGAAGAVIGAGFSGVFSYLSHQYDLDAKVIELSVGILRAPVTEESKPLRQWAIDVMGKRANFQFDKTQRAALLNEPLPYLDTWSAPMEGGSRPPKGPVPSDGR